MSVHVLREGSAPHFCVLPTAELGAVVMCTTCQRVWEAVDLPWLLRIFRTSSLPEGALPEWRIVTGEAAEEWRRKYREGETG